MRTKPLLLGALVLALSIPGLAIPVTDVFTVSGSTSGGSVGATVTFSSTGAGNLTIELQNTSGTIRNAAQILDGLYFNLPGASLSLVSVNFGSQPGAGLITTWDSKHTSSDYLNPPYNWTISASGLLAPASGWKPGGVVNNNVFTAPNASITNGTHDPLLIDPIFTFTGTDINLYDLGTSIITVWGTGPEKITTTCTSGCVATPPPPTPTPEPSSLALLGSGLLVAAYFSRHRLFKG